MSGAVPSTSTTTSTRTAQSIKSSVTAQSIRSTRTAQSIRSTRTAQSIRAASPTGPTTSSSTARLISAKEKSSTDTALSIDDTKTAKTIKSELYTAVPQADSSENGKNTVSSDSEDENLYDNFNNYVNKCTRVNQIEEKARSNIVAKPDTKPAWDDKLVGLSDSDSDDQIKEIDEDVDVLVDLQRRGERYHIESEKKFQKELEGIKQMAKVKEALPGELPEMYYNLPARTEALEGIQRLREMRAEVNAMSQASNEGTEEIVVIDGSGKLKDRRSNPFITLIIKDLHTGAHDVEPFDVDTPLMAVVEPIAKKWGCPVSEVMVSVNDVVVSDYKKTPKDLELSTSTSHILSAVRSIPIDPEETRKEAANQVKLRFQMENVRPVFVAVNRKRPFKELVQDVAAEMKVARIKRLVFDNEDVEMKKSPEDYEMEDEDCLDVYAD